MLARAASPHDALVPNISCPTLSAIVALVAADSLRMQALCIVPACASCATACALQLDCCLQCCSSVVRISARCCRTPQPVGQSCSYAAVAEWTFEDAREAIFSSFFTTFTQQRAGSVYVPCSRPPSSRQTRLHFAYWCLAVRSPRAVICLLLSRVGTCAFGLAHARDIDIAEDPPDARSARLIVLIKPHPRELSECP